MRQDEKCRRIDRPGIVRCKIAAESEAAEEARPDLRITAVLDVRASKQLPCVLFYLLKASIAPGHKLDGRAGAGEGDRAAFCLPVKA